MLGLILFFSAFTFVFTISWKYIYYKWFIKTRFFITWEKMNSKVDILRVMAITVCIVCLGLYIGLRWSLGLKNIIDYNLFKQPRSEFRSANISIVFMLDLSSFIGVLILILKLFDNKHKHLLKPLAFLSILGGYAAIFFTCTATYSTLPMSNVTRPWDAYYFFFSARTIGVGDSDEPLMFLMHFWMVTIGVHTVVWDGRITLKDFGIILFSIILYAIYIFGVSRGLNIETHVTAMVKGDFVIMDKPYYEAIINGQSRTIWNSKRINENTIYIHHSKTAKTKDKYLKGSKREKKNLQGATIAFFSTKRFEARRHWNDIFKEPKVKKMLHRCLCLAKNSFKNKGKSHFRNKQKLRGVITDRPL